MVVKNVALAPEYIMPFEKAYQLRSEAALASNLSVLLARRGSSVGLLLEFIDLRHHQIQFLTLLSSPLFCLCCIDCKKFLLSYNGRFEFLHFTAFWLS